MSGESRRNVLSESRRRAILQAALRLFLTKGFTDTTMEDIRQSSGASTGSIYHHFENKETLAIALYHEGRDELNTRLFEVFLLTDAKEGLKKLVYTYLDWFEQSPDLGLYMLQAASTEYLGRHLEELRQSFDSFSPRFLDWLARFIEAGIIVRYPQHLYTPLAIGPTREFIRRWLRTRELEQLHEAREPLAETAWRILSSGT